MTLNAWLELDSSNNWFDFVLTYPELVDKPEWMDWEERMDKVLRGLPYQDAKHLSFEDLISLAGLAGEIELARKECETARRLENLQQDF